MIEPGDTVDIVGRRGLIVVDVTGDGLLILRDASDVEGEDLFAVDPAEIINP